MDLRINTTYKNMKAIENLNAKLLESKINLVNFLIINEENITDYKEMIKKYATPLIYLIDEISKNLDIVCLSKKEFDYIKFHYWLKKKSTLLLDKLNNLKSAFYSNNDRKGKTSQQLLILYKQLIKNFDLTSSFRDESINTIIKFDKAMTSNKLSDWGDALNMEDLNEYRVFNSWEQNILEKIEIMHQEKYNDVEKAIGKINFYISNALSLELEAIFNDVLYNNYDKTIFMNKNVPQIIDNTLKILYPHIKQLFNENF